MTPFTPGPWIVLQAPAKGEPCNGCGWCCRAELCAFAAEAFGPTVSAPCPALRVRDGRTWCGMVEEAARVNVAFGSHFAWQLGLGMGCDAEFSDSERLALQRADGDRW